MDWYPIEVIETTGPDWLAIDPALRGHWHALLAVCYQRENDGVFKDSAAWPDRSWDRLAGVTQKDLEAMTRTTPRPLVRWVGPDLHVLGFDRVRQNRAAAKKTQAKEAARRRWNADANADANAQNPQMRNPESANASAYPDKIRGDKRRGEERRHEERSPPDFEKDKSGVERHRDLGTDGLGKLALEAKRRGV